MRAVFGAGYSPTVPTEAQVVAEGRRRPSSSRRPMLVVGGYGSLADYGAIEPRSGMAAFTDSGGVAISAEFGGTSTWGNDTVQARISEGWTYIKAQQPCATDKVLLVAQSMGGLDVLNWAHAHLASVAAIALLIPAIDLADIHDNNRAFAPHPGGFAADIEAAYGGLAGYQAAVGTHNPATRAADYAGIPIRIWYSTSDPIAVPSATTAFAASAGASLVSQGAVGHAVTGVGLREVYDFLAAA